MREIFSLGLLFCTLAATAQVSDTVRVDQSVDTVVTVDTAIASYKAADGIRDQAEPVKMRSVPDSIVRDWKNDKEYAYANDPAYWRVDEKNGDKLPDRGWGLLNSAIIRYTLLILLGGVLLYAVFRIIADNNLRLFYRSPAGKAAGPGGEIEPEEQDLEGQLRHFLQIKDYRQSVRYLYLKSLRMLKDRGLIRYHQETTNREYLRQLTDTPQRGPFGELTMAYEKVWYGEFPLSDGQFERLHHYFEDFYKTVGA